MAGIPTTAHSRVLEEYVPADDAVVAQPFARGRGILLGKLACLEFAHARPTSDQAWPRKPIRGTRHMDLPAARSGDFSKGRQGSAHPPGSAWKVSYLLSMWRPVWRRRDSHSGFRTERENLAGDAKGKRTSGYNRIRFHSLWVGKAGGELLRGSPPLSGASVLSASRATLPSWPASPIIG